MRFKYISIILIIIPTVICGQYSYERLDQLNSTKTFVLLENNRNLAINRRCSTWFNFTARTSLRLNDWRTNFYEIVPSLKLYRNNNIALNFYSKFSSRYAEMNSGNTNLSANVEVIYEIEGFNILVNTSLITEPKLFLAKLTLGYRYSSKWSFISSIGNSYEYNYIYNSLNFGILLNENLTIGKILVEFPKVDDVFSTKFSRILLSIGTSF